MFSSFYVCAQEKGGTTSSADKESEYGDVLHSSDWPDTFSCSGKVDFALVFILKTPAMTAHCNACAF